MTNEKAIGLLNEQKGYNRKMATAWAKSSWTPEPGEVGGAAFFAQRYKDMADALELALSALSAHTTPTVKPLTLAQLGQMNGQPIYIQILHTGEGRWGLLKALGECVAEILMPDGKTSYHLIDLYGKTWTAYAYPPPVHIDREAWEPCRACGSCDSCFFSCCDKRGEPCRNCRSQDHNRYRPMKFCPKCGRPLTEIAWAELEKRLVQITKED